MAAQISCIIFLSIFAFSTVSSSAPFINEAGDLWTTNEETDKVANEDDYRLKKNDVFPISYALELTILDGFIQKQAFSGKVDIVLDFKKDLQGVPKKSIFLHTVGLKWNKYKFFENGAENVDLPASTIEHEQFQTVELIVQKDLDKTKKYTLSVEFTGTLRTDMTGLYITTYKNSNGDTEYALATQFQPTHARKVFPCFDEPEYKATFNLRLSYPKSKHYKALFNTKSEGTQGEIETFETTPPMSTYLLAVVISKFEDTRDDSDTIKHAVWSRFPKNSPYSKYALDSSKELLPIMKSITNKDYTGVNIGKVDHVALPDFSAGAMENWGLVTYRESLLLQKDDQSTTRSKQRACTIVAHELAHFWFGNLLTTNWWDNTWLNEGFARYFEYFAAHQVEKEWELDRQFVVEQHLAVMNADSLPTSKAINHEVNSPEQIMGKFGAISYNKGASIIRMMSHFEDQKAFEAGLKKYFATGKPTAVPGDLWTAMADIKLPGSKKVAQVMQTYVEQPGVPLLKVVLDGDKVKITQKRFELVKPKKRADLYYYVPISYTPVKGQSLSFDDTKPRFLLDNNAKAEVEIDLNPDVLFIVNIKATAYARVHYDDKLYNKIVDALHNNDFGKIDVLNRAQLVDDALNIARAEEENFDYEKAFKLVNYIRNEKNYYPWYTALNGFQYLLRRLPKGSNESKQLKEFIRELMTTVYQDNAEVAEPNAHIRALRNTLTKSWMCNLGDQTCINDMIALFKAFKEDDKNEIEPDLRGTAYCTALKHSDNSDDWTFLYDRLQDQSILPSETLIILPALGCTNDIESINTYLSKILETDSEIRGQDVALVFSSVVTGSDKGPAAANEFLQTNYAEIHKKYGSINVIPSMLTTLIDSFTTAQEIEQFRTFLKNNDIPSKDVANTLLDTATQNVEWTDRKKHDIVRFFRKPEGEKEKEKDKDGSAGSILASVLLVASNLLIIMFSRI